MRIKCRCCVTLPSHSQSKMLKNTEMHNVFLSRFGVRPLPKKQMVLKLKEIHQYTHQLQGSESEEETSGPQRPPNASNSQFAPLSFKQPTAPPAVSPMKLPTSEEDELLSASQNSNTSSTAESERYSSYMAIPPLWSSALGTCSVVCVIIHPCYTHN